MAANPIAIAYALIVLLSVFLLVTVLQLVQTARVLRAQRAARSTAPKRSLVFLATAVVALALSYIFDISVTAVTLVEGSVTPPPSGAHLALVVCTTFLGQGLAPCMIYASAFDIIQSRVDLSGLESKDASSAKRRKIGKVVDGFLLCAFPIVTAAYLGVFTKAVLDTPVLASKYYQWLYMADFLYRAVVVIHALLFRSLASRAYSFHKLIKVHGRVDPIVRVSMLYRLTPVMFIRTVAILAFTPLASSFASPRTPASAMALLFAFTLFVGSASIGAVQCLLGAARRPSSEWIPDKTIGEREVDEGHVPEDNAPVVEPTGKKRSRADSIALSPTRTSFGPAIRVENETPSHA